MPRWARFCAATILGGAAAAAVQVAVVYWRWSPAGSFWRDLMSFAVTAQAAGFFALLLALVAAAIAMTRLAVGASWPAPTGAAVAGVAVPLVYVLWVLLHAAAGPAQLRTLLLQSWAEIVLFCLPFVVGTELAAWFWQYFD